MKKSPLISVIIPTKNSEPVLDDCLLSIANQTLKSHEIIVVDNSSTDDTLKVAKRYTKNIYIKGPERSAQRNLGAKKAVGKYLLFLDSDMVMTSNVLEQCKNKVTKESNIKGLVIPEESFGIGFWAEAKRLERSFYLGVNYMEASRFFEKKAFIHSGGFDESLVSGEDWYLSQNISKLGNIDRIQAKIMHNEGTLSLSKTIQKKFYYAKHFSKYVDLAQNDHLRGQTSILRRYALFFSNPKKLFKNPILGLGMLFMKGCEFAAGGFGYYLSKWT